MVFLSATPRAYELEMSSTVAEQVVRPTGLVDPEVMVRPTKGQIDDLLKEIHDRIEREHRVLVTTLTKKMAEDLTDYLVEQGLKVRYLHSNVDTIERIEILRASGSASSTCWWASTCWRRASTCPRCRWSPSSTPTRKGSSAARRR